MMEGYYIQSKMKRKDFEQVNDDFSDFSISSPARKIRRLDAELPPINEEEVMEVPIIEHYEPELDFGNNVERVGGGRGGSGRGIVIEELPNDLENDERAIVVFNPVNLPFVASPSNFSVTVNPDLISGFMICVSCADQMMCTYQQSNPFRQADNGTTERDENSATTNNCMAVVPWMPYQVPSSAAVELSSQNDVNDMMDAEETQTATMEVEDSNPTFDPSSVRESGTVWNEGIHQWQQQHCMMPQLPENTSTPVVWFR
ncbi:oxygenase [Lithospermum erythrorhizon]|uniref:Oxygenase n=1 Tax=Lithospermum erythrorhizon TaxID=34254 RepID=A0AAV3QPA7_LITER